MLRLPVVGPLGARLSGRRYHSRRPCRDTPTSVGNRTAIYLRVSKGERHTENQRPDIDLDRCGVQVVSVRETWLDTGSAVRALLIAIYNRDMQTVAQGSRPRAHHRCLPAPSIGGRRETIEIAPRNPAPSNHTAARQELDLGTLAPGAWAMLG
jgi:hypothetical protein